jgi:hypothetical protein
MTLQFSGRWIPVNERLPDEDITVMLHQPDTSDPWILGSRDGDDWRTQDGCWIIYGVTHWADLPAGPEVNQSLTTEHPAGVPVTKTTDGGQHG